MTVFRRGIFSSSGKFSWQKPLFPYWLLFILSEISKWYIVSFLQVSNSFLSPIFSWFHFFSYPKETPRAVWRAPPHQGAPFVYLLPPSGISAPTLELSLRCVTRPHFLKNSDILSFSVRIIIRSHFLSAVMGYNIDQPRREPSLSSAPNSYHVVWHPSQQTSVSVES